MVILWQQLKTAFSSSPSMSRVISAPHSHTRQEGWSKAPGGAGPGQQSSSVQSHRLPELTPVSHEVGEPWRGTTTTRSSRRPGTSQCECANGYLPATKLPNSCHGRGTWKSRSSHPTPHSASVTNLCSADGTTGASLLVTHSVGSRVLRLEFTNAAVWF